MDSYIGEVRILPFPYTPYGWALCDGTLLPIAQNTALFSLIGTTFGGDGRSSVGLPDLMDRTVIGTGQGPGLTPRHHGEHGGATFVTLLDSQMPSHSHTANAMAVTGTTGTPSDQVVLAQGPGGFTPVKLYNPDPEATENLQPGATTVSGETQPHWNLQPYLTMSYYISLYGEYPPRP